MKNEDGCRYLLKKDGSNILYIFGVNPSTATDKNADRTMIKVMRFAEYNGFDGFAMMNLYPQRSTDPNQLHKSCDLNIHQKNIKVINDTFFESINPTVLLAFGDVIEKRNYLKRCFYEITEAIEPFRPKYMQIGELTKLGNPRHPSRVGYCMFTSFDMNNYLKSFKINI